MLRLFVLVLLLANGAYFAWARGMLQPYGYAPVQQSEPQRLEQQIKPETLVILSTDEARRAETVPTVAAARPPDCLQAGLYDDRQSVTIRQALESALPVGSWSLESAIEPARWIIYMGKFPTAEALNKKKSELRALKISFDAPLNPAMEPGLSLGNFENQASANQELSALVQRGVRTARVLQDRAEARGQMVKFAAVDDVLRPKLDELKTVLANKPLRACKA
ncbi:MAG: SPOR domain-containing protein [Comamonadaceae bacterium]|nr:MAG: SPOR domain-containing protein [Comamonadaceae bacterium]